MTSFKIGMSLAKSELNSPGFVKFLSVDSIGGAFTIALSDCRAEGLLDKINISLIWTDDKCDSRLGPEAQYELIDNENVDVIIGSLCSRVTLISSVYASYKNVLLLSSSSSDVKLDDKNVYNNLVRPGVPSYYTIGDTIARIMDNFNWRRMAMVTLELGGCEFSLSSINRVFLERNDLLLSDRIILGVNSGENDIKEALKRISERARIIYVCLTTDQLRSLFHLTKILNMDETEYVFLFFMAFPSNFIKTPWGSEVDDQPNAQEIKNAYESLLFISLSSLAGPYVDYFLGEVPKQTAKSPFFISDYQDMNRTASIYSIFAYDTTYFLCHLLNESVENNRDVHDIEWMISQSKNRYVTGRFGRIELDSNADRLPGYWVWRYNREKSEFQHWLNVSLTKGLGNTTLVKEQNYLPWMTKDGLPVRDTPLCGFRGEKCEQETTDSSKVLIPIASTLVAIIVISISLSIFIYFRRKKIEFEIRQKVWKIDMNDVQIMNKATHSVMSSMKSFKSNISDIFRSTEDGIGENQIYTKIGLYKSLTVAIKSVAVSGPNISFHMNRLKELKEMKEMNHGNLNSFIGLSITPTRIYILWKYCSKGSLQDILENGDIQLDSFFKTSLISDLAAGMNFLHSSILKFHGHLTSSCCLIDSRWSLKISWYGCHDLEALLLKEALKEEDRGDYEIFKKFLWFPPEILKECCQDFKQLSLPLGSKEADVYAFGLILSEILYRGLPFFMTYLSPKEIVAKVIENSNPPFRPTCPKDFQSNEEGHKIEELMKECWNENPEDRPSFSKISKNIRGFSSGKTQNLMDIMIKKLEKYANNLEEIVETRTNELVEEKKKTDSLLYRMLPPTIADRLKRGQIIEAEMYDSATIFFSDVVGFTALSSESSPIEIVNLLNDLYTLFDGILNLYDVYKVETIGDAYMVVSGIPSRNDLQHVVEISNVALHLLESVLTFEVRHKPGLKLNLRIGIHTGPCAAGVVGLKMPRYCLFGDTVNTASRMESTGEPLKIHMSSYCKQTLETVAQGNYEIKLRGNINVKGKGEITTYWLINKTT
ncbi:DgyrCDS12965 [Dimorphilus gyrociliatus]|uniref:Guanylate cyclase n=1 Tax=Dimorphilus gyrociliatus TaxID=2664684 RepID=A0A7I8W986_9ANNE|nr:DgyrCDS12965 [Dimorphilus gyrociliatus]